MTTTRQRSYATVVHEDEQLVLLYLQNATVEPPGLTTVQIAKATGLEVERTRQVLDRLYVHRQVGRQASLLGGKATLWMPNRPIEPLQLKGPPDLPITPLSPPAVCRYCGRAVHYKSRICSSCRIKYDGMAEWEVLDETELKVMMLIHNSGNEGLTFYRTSLFSEDAGRAIQRLQRRGFLGIDVSLKRWLFSQKGRAVCDDYLKARR